MLLLGLLPAPFQFAEEPSEINELGSFVELITGTGTNRKFSPDGAFLATFSMGGGGASKDKPHGLVVWDVQTGDAKVSISEGWLGFEFSSTDTNLAVWTGEKVSIFDLQTGEILATLDHSNVMRVKFVPKANLLVTATHNCGDGKRRFPSDMRFWSTNTWKRVETIVDRSMPLICPIVSRDGKYAAGFKAVENGDGISQTQLKLWELQTGKELTAPNWNPPSSIYDPGIGFTRSGKEIAQFNQVWDIETGAMKPLNAAFDFFLDVDVEWCPPFGSYAHLRRSENTRAKIVDGKITVWDMRNGEQIAQYNNPILEPFKDTLPGSYGAIIPWVFDDALSFMSKDSRSGATGRATLRAHRTLIC